ncbi:MAG TPA: hypothetical protein PKM88_02645 [bacterium]|nr:hypothetical protein [bacterium]
MTERQLAVAQFLLLSWLGLPPLLVWRRMRRSRWRLPAVLIASVSAAVIAWYGIPVMVAGTQRETPLATFWAAGEWQLIGFVIESLAAFLAGCAILWLGKLVFRPPSPSK